MRRRWDDPVTGRRGPEAEGNGSGGESQQVLRDTSHLWRASHAGL